MLLKPRFSKFSKAHKGRVSSIYKTNQTLVKGSVCIIALQSSRLEAGQISAINLTLKRALKKDGIIYWRVFPHIPASAKPAEVRMGKGKGSNDFWYTRIRPGAILLEIKTSNNNLAVNALTSIQCKFPFKSQIITAIPQSNS